MASLINEDQQYFDQVTGELIVNGTVYIGLQNLDPVLNPKNIYSDRALTTSITNPQTTGADGRVNNKIWLSGNYSIKVDDSDGVQRYIELDNGVYESVNVQSHGAVGDGVTDDSAAFLLALNTGLPVYVPKTSSPYLLSTWGQYSTTDILHIESNGATIDIGDSTTKFIKALHSVKLTNINFINCGKIIENLTTDTSSAVSYVVLESSKVSSGRNVIELQRPFDNVRIINNEFASIINTPILLGVNTYADQDNFQRTIITNNIFRGITADASVDLYGALIYGHKCIVSDNIFDSIVGLHNETHAIYTKTRYSVIANNVVKDVEGVTTVSGITLKGAERGATTTNGYASIISNNQIYCNGVTNIGIRVVTDDVIVIGNMVDDGQTDGILVTTGGVDSNRHNITGNNIYGTGVASSIGIRYNANSHQASITNNIVYNHPTGIRLLNEAAKTPTDWLVSNNNIKGCDTGIGFATLSAVETVQVSSNIIDGATYAIRFANVACDNVSVLNNKTPNRAGTPGQIISWAAGAEPTKFNLNHIYYEQTTDATSLTVNTHAIPDDSLYEVEAKISGMKTDGSDRALYHKHGIMYRDGGNATIQGAIADVISPIESNASWNSAIDVASTSIRTRVIGVAATTIDWSINISITKP